MLYHCHVWSSVCTRILPGLFVPVAEAPFRVRSRTTKYACEARGSFNWLCDSQSARPLPPFFHRFRLRATYACVISLAVVGAVPARWLLRGILFRIIRTWGYYFTGDPSNRQVVLLLSLAQILISPCARTYYTYKPLTASGGIYILLIALPVTNSRPDTYH